MTVLTAGPKPVSDSTKESSSTDLRLSVTGVDVKGLMFRHPATVLALDGRDCVFRSESQPELDGSVLAEFNYEGANPQTRVSQAHVKSNQPDPQGGYKVVVELEYVQNRKVNPVQATAPPAPQKPAVLPPLATQKAAVLPPPEVTKPLPAAVEPKASQGPAPSSLPFPTPVPKEFPLPVKISEIASQQPKPKMEERAPIPVEIRTPAPSMQQVNEREIEERIKAAVASEMRREMTLLKNSISSEVEKALPTMVASKMEKLIREDVEKQFQSSYETSIQVLQADVARKMETRIYESSDLQALLQNVSKKYFEEHAAQFQSEVVKAGEEMSSRAAAIMRPYEQSITGLEARMNISRTEIEASNAALQSIKQEINAGIAVVQEALQQLREAEKPDIEKMREQAAAQLTEWSAQFDNLLNKSATEKAIQFSLDMERRIAPHRQRADESAEKLGAMLQLLQGTARVQQERLNEHSVAAAANFEKQIKAFLIRLGGGA